MSEAILPRAEPARHWSLDAALGAGAALAIIMLGQAALPDRAQATAPEPAPRVAVPAAAPAEPAALIAFEHPVEGRDVVSPFGLRQLPWEENGRLHEGVDIAAPLGSPVLAAADGVVAAAGRSDSYGRFVRIVHAEGLTSLYAHMGAVADEMFAGRAVQAGTPVGRIGSSGTSTGPHLHFELRDERDRPLNPGLFLGREFAAAEDLPLKKARRVPRGVRIAWVSRIPESKRELMAARQIARTTAMEAAKVAKSASVTVFYGDGRPHARFNVAPATQAPATAAASAPTPAPASDAPIPTAEAPAA